MEFQKRVSEAYGKFKEMARDDGHWVTVAAEGKSIDDLHSEILEKVIHYMNEEVDNHDISGIASSLFM